MKKITQQLGIILLAGALVLTGCKSTQEYASLAQAGTNYTTAMDNLLVTTIDISIDVTSEQLLQDDALVNQKVEDYQRLSKPNEELIRTIQKLRDHTQLLARYFNLLSQLATTNAAGRIQTEIGSNTSGLLGSLNQVSTQLKGSNLFTASSSAVVAPLTQIVVGGIVRGALKTELEQRKETIQQELALQERLLKALAKKVGADLELIKEIREQRLVIEALTAPAPIAGKDAWLGARRTVLKMPLTVEQLNTASETVKKLREAFEDLCNGKLTRDRLNALVSDFAMLLQLTEKLKAA